MKVFTPVYFYVGIIATSAGLFINWYEHQLTVIGLAIVIMGFSLMWMAFYDQKKIISLPNLYTVT